MSIQTYKYITAIFSLNYLLGPLLTSGNTYKTHTAENRTEIGKFK